MSLMTADLLRRTPGVSPSLAADRWPRRHPLATIVAAVLALMVAVWSVKLVGEYRGASRARAYWSSPQGPAGGLLYVALGDSTAQGVGASKPDRGYVGLLAEHLRTTTGQPVRVINLSVSGARVQDVLDRQIPALRNLRPDVVTVAIGGNDVRAYNADAFASRVERLTAALPAGTFIADVPWFMHGRWERQAQQAADVVTRSASRRGLNVVPLHRALQRRGWTAMVTDFAPDWFHPNDRGYRVWSDTFWTAISRTPRQQGPLIMWGARPTRAPRGRSAGLHAR